MSVVLKCSLARPMARTRLLCFAHAGGGAAAFRGWAELLPGSIELFAAQLPAREDRLQEAPFLFWHAMFESLVAATERLPPQPTALFGHSLGALVALELARWMRDHRGTTPVHLFLAARPWPGQAQRSAKASELDDDALLEFMDQRYGSLSTGLASKEIREVMLPVLRSDLTLLESYAYVPATPLQCPLTFFAGDLDPATCDEELGAWSAETRGPFRCEKLPAGHFFLDSMRALLTSRIASELTGIPR